MCHLFWLRDPYRKLKIEVKTLLYHDLNAKRPYDNIHGRNIIQMAQVHPVNEGLMYDANTCLSILSTLDVRLSCLNVLSCICEWSSKWPSSASLQPHWNECGSPHFFPYFGNGGLHPLKGLHPQSTINIFHSVQNGWLQRPQTIFFHPLSKIRLSWASVYKW